MAKVFVAHTYNTRYSERILKARSKETMAVKQHEIVHDNAQQIDLALLAQYIQLFNQQPSFLPTPPELIKCCKDVVICLARVQIPRDSNRLLIFKEQVRQVEEFLQTIVAADLSVEFRNEVIFSVLQQLYAIISDPQAEACPAACIVLSLMQGEFIGTAVQWLVQEANASGPAANAGLSATLACLYRWLWSWQCTPNLSDWVLSFMKGLQEMGKSGVLMDVSVANIEKLFDALLAPPPVPQVVAPIVFHILASMRQTTVAFDKIAPKVPYVFEKLASDSDPQSRSLLQNLVDVTSSLIEQQSQKKYCEDEDNNKYEEKYANIIACLDTHITSKSCPLLTVQVWKKTEPIGTHTQAPGRKIGLINLGNTCYMNSVLQALLLTKQFSNSVLLKMTKLPYWSKLSQLFVLMKYSSRPRLDPGEFFTLVKPPNFTTDHQHDSSEFLGYLLELLHVQEKYPIMFSKTPETSKTPIIIAHSSKGCSATSTYPNITNNNNNSNGSGSNNTNNEQDSNNMYEKGKCSPKASKNGPLNLKTNDSIVISIPQGKKSPKSCDMDSGHNSVISKLSEPSAPSIAGIKRPDSEKAGGSAPKRRCLWGPNDNTAYRWESPSLIQSTFGGVQLTRVQCSVCHSASLRRDMFRDLQLAFPERPLQGKHTVQGLLDYYCSPERLSGENRYECTECGVLRDAEKSVLIERAPKYLILVLKNFRFNPKLQVQTKLFHAVHQDRMVALPLSRPQEPRAAYKLYAAIIHTGPTMDSGHYYTFAQDNDQWFKFNDDTVDTSTESDLNTLARSSTPYILFYRRTDVDESPVFSILEELPQHLVDVVRADNKDYMEQLQSHKSTGCTTRAASSHHSR